LLGPEGTAVDGAGNIWSADRSSNHASKFTIAGTLLGDFSAGGTPEWIALDSQGNAWFSTRTSGSVTKLTNSGAAATGSPFTSAGVSSLYGLAVDGAGNVWVADYDTGGGVFELSNSGTLLSPPLGYTGGVINSAGSPTIDGSGNVWVETQANASLPGGVVELVGAATPVITPLAAGLPATPTSDGSSKLGTRP
jgi:hypothetical protein